AIFEANLKDQAAGGQGTDPTFTCLAPGMPRVMNVYEPMEIVVTPYTTYLLMQHIHDSRRIFTDGRDWPRDDVEPTFAGYSIGHWVDQDGHGRYDALMVETRNLKGPRSYDSTGLPLHRDNPGRHQRKDLPRQGRCEHALRRNHRDRSCADASLDH